VLTKRQRVAAKRARERDDYNDAHRKQARYRSCPYCGERHSFNGAEDVCENAWACLVARCNWGGSPHHVRKRGSRPFDP
jgi:hypothetical protein